MLFSFDENLSFVFIKFALKMYFIIKKTNAYIFDNSIHIWHRHDRDRMVVGFTTACAISGYHHWCYQFESRSDRGVQHYVIKFVSDSDRSVVFSVSSGFLQYNWPHDITEILLKVVLSTIKHKPKVYIKKIHCIKYCSYVLFKLSLDNNCVCSFFFLLLQKMIKQPILNSVHFLVQLL